MMQIALRLLTPLLVVACVLFLPLVACQSMLIYMPRPYPPETVDEWRRSHGGEVVEFTTSQGRQRAFLQGNLESPGNLWIVAGGNATLALDWSSWLAEHAPGEDAWLLVDFPGYGESEGRPNPERIGETFREAIPAAAESVGMGARPDPSRLRFFGHSLGAAACLIAAEEFDIRSGVLVSPFTSTMEMSRLLFGVPLGFLVTHRFDNEARLDGILAGGPADIIIVHGSHDEVVPARMGRSLAEGREEGVRLIEVEGGRHNDIGVMHGEVLARALEEARGGAGR